MKPTTMTLPIWLAFILCLGASGLSLAESRTVNKTFEVKPGGTLNISSNQGEIEVQPHGKNTVEIRVRLNARRASNLEEFDLNFDTSGDDVSVIGRGPSGGGWGNWGGSVKAQYLAKVPRNYNVDLRTGGGQIVVGDLNGEVRVDTSGGSIKVGDIQGDVQADTSGGSIRVGKVEGEVKLDTSGGSITLESSTRDVVADTSGGSIRIGPSGGSVRADTSGGSIEIGPAKGDITADTSGGSIRITGGEGRVKADTSGGRIHIEDVKGAISADTSGGMISMRNVYGPVKADTSGGDIEVEMAKKLDNTKVDISLDTSGGDIELSLPADVQARVNARSRLGWRNEDAQIVSDFPLEIERSDGELVGQGDINGGGGRIQLRTSNGDITLRRMD